jgi:hypothetical protein
MEQYRPVAEALLGRGDVKEILAFLLRTHYAQKPRPLQPERDGDRDEERSGGDGASARPPREDRPRREERPRRDRDERPRREPRPEGADVNSDDAQGPPADIGAATNLYVTLGQRDGFADLLALAKYLGELSGVDAAHFTGAGSVRDHSSHIEVDHDVADAVIAGVHGKARPGPTPVKEGADTPVAQAPTRDPLAPVMESEADAGAAAATEGPRTILCERARSQGGDRRRGGFRGDRDRGRGRDGGRGRRR